MVFPNMEIQNHQSQVGQQPQNSSLKKPAEPRYARKTAPPSYQSFQKKAPEKPLKMKKRPAPPSSHQRISNQTCVTPSSPCNSEFGSTVIPPSPLALPKHVGCEPVPLKRNFDYRGSANLIGDSDNDGGDDYDDLLSDKVDPYVEAFMRMPRKRPCTETSLTFMRSSSKRMSTEGTYSSWPTYGRSSRALSSSPPVDGIPPPPPSIFSSDPRVKGELYPLHSLSLLD